MSKEIIIRWTTTPRELRRAAEVLEMAYKEFQNGNSMTHYKSADGIEVHLNTQAMIYEKHVTRS